MGSKGPKWVLSSFHKTLSLLFVRNNVKCKTLKFCFPVQTCYLGKFWLTSYQPKCTSNDLRILWSSVSLERIHRYLLFFARIYSQRKCSIWNYCFWLALSRHAQTYSNLPRFTSGVFGWSWDMTRLKIFLNDSLRYIFHMIIWKLKELIDHTLWMIT